MCLVERSGFGLNALLGLIATHPKAALATHEALERTAHDQNHAPLEGQQRPLMQSRTQEAAAPPPPDVRLQVSDQESREPPAGCLGPADCRGSRRSHFSQCQRSEAHTSELQSLMRI